MLSPSEASAVPANDAAARLTLDEIEHIPVTCALDPPDVHPVPIIAGDVEAWHPGAQNEWPSSSAPPQDSDALFAGFVLANENGGVLLNVAIEIAELDHRVEPKLELVPALESGVAHGAGNPDRERLPAEVLWRCLLSRAPRRANRPPGPGEEEQRYSMPVGPGLAGWPNLSLQGDSCAAFC
jgi:hypothetical protein